ncbi:MAG: SIR2 family protein [Anaerolineae bacterium]|nr:SIR2 family protein [Anaerolineae bacterium]
MYFREFDDVKDTLIRARERGISCSVLIGAGCSVKAGIPTAQGFVQIIEKNYPRDFARASEKTYPYCMAELATAEQRDLITGYIDKAKVNWAYIALAQLMRDKYIDRVLTTNFDPLIMRACALINLYPAVYDLAASQKFEPEKVPSPAIFHLHGQSTGFILINSKKAMQEHSKKLGPLFEDAGRGRVWLVIGYSGLNDPVFNHLAKVTDFENRLYWIGYQDDEPADHLKRNLLGDDKHAFYVKGFDADGFLVTLAQKLGCFPPDFVGKPFSYLENLYDTLTDYTLPKSDMAVNAMRYARSFVHEAVNNTQSIHSDTLQAWSDLLSGQYERVIALKEKSPQKEHPEIKNVIAWAYLALGNETLKELETSTDKDATYRKMCRYYQSAVLIKVDFHEALNNWGNALSEWAQTKSGSEAEELLRQACEKYESALSIKADKHEALNNWGVALSEWAQTKSGSEADELFRQSIDIFMKSEKLQEGRAAYNLACVSALMGRELDCQTWLEKSKQAGNLPSRQHIETDTDLDGVRHKDWFKCFVEEI